MAFTSNFLATHAIVASQKRHSPSVRTMIMDTRLTAEGGYAQKSKGR
jgi:hypothetical protein